MISIHISTSYQLIGTGVSACKKSTKNRFRFTAPMPNFCKDAVREIKIYSLWCTQPLQ